MTFGKSSRDIVILTDLFHAVYVRNSREPAMKVILDKYVNYLRPLFYATQSVYLASVASISVLPFLISLLIHSPYYSLDLFFPGVDKNTWSGFMVTYFYLFVGSYFWVPTLIASDVLYFAQLILAASHLRVMIKWLDSVEERISGRDEVGKSEELITNLLKRVCYEHQQHLK